MTKVGLIAVAAATTLLGGCGGSTKTVTVSTPTPSPSNSAGGTGAAPSAVAACLNAAGAAVRGPKPAGRGSAVYAITRDGADIGFVKAPNSAIAARLQPKFAAAGFHTRVLKNDVTAFAIYKGTLTRLDSASLSKCTR
jgi:hypothetical protein